MKKYLKVLNVFDICTIVFYVFLISLNIIFYQRVHHTFNLLVIEILTIVLIFIIAYQDYKVNNSFWKQLHYWYLAPMILITFKQLYYMVHPIHPIDYDELLIKIDRWIFGVDPTHFLYQYSHPVITEILQIVYTSFYLLPIIVGIDLLRNKKYEEFEFAAFLIVYGFFLSYLGYFSLPAVGPRFTLHDFFNIDNELPGLLLTPYLREFVNIGESIPKGVVNPHLLVQRDVFPSGHTQMTLLTMYATIKFNTRTKYFIIPTGILLIISTVYLRYHYVIDLIAGAIFMIITLWTGRLIYRAWNRYTERKIPDWI
ncbi:MAG: phosphatase PAP2 family protein [Ignavibacteria bacterium]|nr:phosphatase PAP2 family protein [Ignavibacteria bacterium]MDH7527318.1 phosphatase PAP2 family protein [Ignavibacteria bacterium]